MNNPSVLVTGGATGADSIAFECTYQFGIDAMGFVPKGWLKKSVIPEEGSQATLTEMETDSFKDRDKKNHEQSDALIAFLSTKPKTGKGTMQTASLFIKGFYRPDESNKREFLTLAPPLEVFGPKELTMVRYGIKPVVVVWDVETHDSAEMTRNVNQVRAFLNKYKPDRLMISGCTEEICPGIQKAGVEMMKAVLKCS
ncbi:MAG: YpsA SLOG family protein [Promethearchaeota archaeon]